MVVVIGYGPTAEGQAALSSGIAIARERGTSAVVVISQRRCDGTDDAATHVVTLRERAQGEDVEVEVREPDLSADPVEELLSVAEQVSADLIVVGLRRRSPVGKLILGTSTQRILLDAACPVLTVKSDR